MEGHRGEARAHLEAALDRFLTRGYPREALQTLCDLGALETEAGHLVQAGDALARAEALMASVDDPVGGLRLRCRRGLLALARGEPAAARAEFAAAEGLTERLDLGPASLAARELAALREAAGRPGVD